MSAPIITANWEADSDDTWTVPVGGGFGKIFRIGNQPLNAQLQGFYNVEHPQFGPEWIMRVQLQFLFPKLVGSMWNQCAAAQPASHAVEVGRLWNDAPRRLGRAVRHELGACPRRERANLPCSKPKLVNRRKGDRE